MRVLALGWDIEGPGVVRADLLDAESLASFDVVLLDPESLPNLWLPYSELSGDGTWRIYPGRDLGLSRALDRLLSLRREEIADLLFRGGGLLVVRVRSPGEGVEIFSVDAPPRHIDRYSLLPRASLVNGPHHLAIPQGLKFLPRRGHDVVDIDATHPIFHYLDAFRGLGYEAVITSVFGVPLSAFGKVLAKNRVGDVLAWELPIENGRILFLPAFPGLDPRRASELLLPAVAAILTAPLTEEGPDWLARYPLPGEEELQIRVQELALERERLARMEEEISEARKSYDVLRGLLYPRGLAGLYRAAHAAFLRLGFQCSPLPNEPHAFIATADEGEALVRVALSLSSPIGPEEHRALLLLLDRLRTEERRDLKGILVAVAEPRLDPRRRGQQWQEAVRLGCEEHRLSLVAGYDLFQAMVHVLAGGEGAQIRRALLSGEGEWRWKG